MSDDTTTEARIIEPVGELVIASMAPGAEIVANLEQLREHIAGIAKQYKGVEVTEEYLGAAKKERAYLNNLVKSIDQKRKDVKKAYSRPVEIFEEQVKQLYGPIKEASDLLDQQIKEIEEDQKAKKREAIRQHWLGVAGILADVVTFEQIEDVRWQNASVPITKAFSEIEATIDRIASDEQTLSDLGLSHPDEAKAEYFATLDLAKAITRSKQLDEQEARTRAFEEEKARVQAPPTPEPEPSAEAPSVVEQSTPVTYGPAVIPAVAQSAPPAACRWTIQLTCTRDELTKVGAAIKALGIEGAVATRA